MKWHIWKALVPWALVASLAACSERARDTAEPTVPQTTGSAGTMADSSMAPPSGEPETQADSPVGTWFLDGVEIPARVEVTLSFGSDGIMRLEETIAPVTTPVGWMPGNCVTGDAFSATYTTSRADGASTLTWKLISGRTNSVVGCEDPEGNSTGTPMTPADVESYIAGGYMPPTTFSYELTPGFLVLNPKVTKSQFADGLRGRSVFTQVAAAAASE